MLRGDRVTLRGITRDDLPRLGRFNNDLPVELAGGGDPPIPQGLERLQVDFDREAAKGGRDGATFAIEVDGPVVGQCGLMAIDETHRTALLGIAIDDVEEGRPREHVWSNGRDVDAVRMGVLRAEWPGA